MSGRHQQIMSSRLRKLVLDTDKSYRQVAEEMGIHKNVLLRTANGKGMPNSRQLIPICKYFGVSADYLLGLGERREHADK